MKDELGGETELEVKSLVLEDKPVVALVSIVDEDALDRGFDVALLLMLEDNLMVVFLELDDIMLEVKDPVVVEIVMELGLGVKRLLLIVEDAMELDNSVVKVVAREVITKLSSKSRGRR